MIKQTTFKAGDKIYHPLVSRDIRVLTKPAGKSEKLLVAKEDKDNIFIFEESGCEYRELHRYSSIFHATEENCELLSKLYGEEFEKPKSNPTPDTIVKKMLNDGYAYVICSILLPDGVVKDIISGYEGIAFLGEYDNYYYDEVIPLDAYTGKIIVDYIDGKPVLEDE